MEASKSLLTGKDFEKFVFGESAVGQEYVTYGRAPLEFNFRSSIRYVIRRSWREYGEAVEKGLPEPYNPAHPNTGMTHSLWQAVKRHLPKRIRKRGSIPLNLYVAVGRNSIDWCHGVDAFFWWQGAVVSFDVSLKPKDKSTGLKADLLLGPQDLTSLGIEEFGRKVADLLKRRYRERKSENEEHCKVLAFEEDD